MCECSRQTGTDKQTDCRQTDTRSNKTRYGVFTAMDHATCPFLLSDETKKKRGGREWRSKGGAITNDNNGLPRFDFLILRRILNYLSYSGSPHAVLD